MEKSKDSTHSKDLNTKKKSNICVNWLKYGDCAQKNCSLPHKDCEAFTKTQKCSNQANCDGYHRRMCNNWKREGKCAKNTCNYLHKTCDKECDDKICPFFHDVHGKNFDEIMEIFRKKCLLCEENKLLVCFDCGDTLFCEKCAKEIINKGKCPFCNSIISDFIS